MESFAKYAFNKSHAAAYALISYRTAYLKARYPREYYASLITSVLSSTDKLLEYTEECSKLGIKVLPPDVNRSFDYFSVDENNIRFGLLALKNVGRSLITSIVEEREKNGLYTDFADFIYRLRNADINKRQIEALIKVGAFSSFGKTRAQLMKVYEMAVDSALSISRTTRNGQLDITSLLIDDSSEIGIKIDYPSASEFKLEELLIMEKEIAGMFFSGHILDSYHKHIMELNPVRILDVIGNQDNIAGYRDKQKVKVAGIITKKTIKRTKNNDDMAFLTLEDETGEIELIAFPKQYVLYSDAFNVKDVVFVTGTTTIKDEEPCKIIVDTSQIVLLNEEYDKARRKLYLKVDSINSPIVQQIIDILKEYNGETEIIFFDASTKKYIKSLELKIDVDENVINALKMILGENNVILK
jgi:DNA polymerase-3 subunit alpha